MITSFVPMSVKILNPMPEDIMYKHIEACGRVCYRSEGKISDTSAKAFLNTIMHNGHLSVLEHAAITIIAVVDRGLSHEIVRHRLGSYSQESTRYCDGVKGIQFILPNGMDPDDRSKEASALRDMARQSAANYLRLREMGNPPQMARWVLINGLATTIAMTFNIRQWMHILNQRFYNKGAHPDMIKVMSMINDLLISKYPILFKNQTPMA